MTQNPLRRPNAWSWAGEPDLVPVFALAAALILGGLVFAVLAISGI